MRPELAEALRSTITFMNPNCFLKHVLTQEQIMADPVILARSIGREPKKLTLTPNPRTPIRVGKKEANINEH